MRKLIIYFILLIGSTLLHADEGMWMLDQLDDLLIQKMQKKGCKLSSDDIYNTKEKSLKDAIIIFANGCTGVVVSDKGLIFTNHHCGYAGIQQISSVENNFLNDGFTAIKQEDEIPIPGLTVKFLHHFENVTDRVLSADKKTISIHERKIKKDSIINTIKKEYTKDNNFQVHVCPFYSNNAFYMIQYEEFKDIRLAYTPPTSIGKYGGDTDNWMWPRHTGDFAVFRIYADSINQAAEYSEANIPYRPKKVIPISLEGYKENDFAMILGNPGRTSRYITSYGLSTRIKAVNQARIDVRGEKQRVWKSFMKKNDAINLAYANKYAASSNYWKNSIGMNQAIEQLKVVEQKISEEQKLKQWIQTDEKRNKKYGYVLELLERNYKASFDKKRAINYLTEALIYGVELPHIAWQIKNDIEANLPIHNILVGSSEIYKNYHAAVDQATFSVMLQTYKQHVNKSFLPDIYQIINKKFKGNYEAFSDYIFKKSIFANKDNLTKKLQRKRNNLDKDPAILFHTSIKSMLNELNNKNYRTQLDSIEHAKMLIESALQEYYAEKNTPHYPDANFTMRMTYGNISGYPPADAVSYHYYTTTQGILEKEIPGDIEFDLLPELKELIIRKNFGRYADKETNELPVNFLSNNDITGGNSGSPVFNAYGELIGLAFDGNWEAMSGDIIFEQNLQRCINVDVRYILFIMDKIGKAERLLKELIIK